MYRLNGERITLDVGGPSVDVEPIHSWQIEVEAAALRDVFLAASRPQDEYGALNALIAVFVSEAQPVWDIADHLGPVPATARGMARLPLDMQLAMLGQWLESRQVAEQAKHEPITGIHLVESGAASAVDTVIPLGPFNAAVKRRLRAKKAERAAA